MTRLFGTDGIRSTFGEPPLDEATVTALGAALADDLRARGDASPLVVLGGDTRDSTPRLCEWLASGLGGRGVPLRYAGTIPTPGVAWLTRQLGASCGIAVSASHNPHPDNGIKLISASGFKWADTDEEGLEARLRTTSPGWGRESGLGPPEASLVEAYLGALAAMLPDGQPLAGLRLVLDAAHGAASDLAAPLFRRLGAEVELLFAAPDGRNINQGSGSTHPAAAAARTREGYDLGIAFDGDADRAILIDEAGEVRDGDAILYLWAQRLARAGELPGRAIVATSMSNLGLERALAREGIAVERCGVGDREVVATLRERNLRLGGEQSGHIVDLRRSTTGDGLLTALTMAHLVAESGRPLSALLQGFRRYPQILRNVRVKRRSDLLALPRVAEAARRAEAELGRDGRLVLRFSGTEPLARVMIEGPEQARVEALADGIATAIEEELG